MEKYMAAVIFLGVIAFIIIILALVYLILKKGLCNCGGGDSKKEEEEDLEVGSADESDQDFGPYYGSQDHTIDMTANGAANTDEVPPVITVTEFQEDTKKKKKHSMKSMLKKIKKPLNKVRFGGVSESEMKPLVPADSSTPMKDETHLAPLHRSDSMESFVSTSSGMSTMTANIEEFGEEVSPGRLQISLEYDDRNWTINVGIKQAECLIHNKNATIFWQVHLTFLPFKKHRFKTKYKASSTPVFNQTFDVDNIPKQALNQISIRFRVYGREGRAGRKKLAGEVEIQLSKLASAEGKLLEWYVLKRKKVGSEKPK